MKTLAAIVKMSQKNGDFDEIYIIDITDPNQVTYFIRYWGDLQSRNLHRALNELFGESNVFEIIPEISYIVKETFSQQIRSPRMLLKSRLGDIKWRCTQLDWDGKPIELTEQTAAERGFKTRPNLK